MLDGLLVDLVPFSSRFEEFDRTWINNESSFWGSGGEWYITTRNQYQMRVQHMREHAGRPDSGVRFGVQLKDGTPIGFVSINWLVPHSRLGMLGAKIGNRDYWGGGYGTDAIMLLIDYAFDWLDLHKLWLMTTSFNVRVQKQVTRLGFSFEGRQRESTLANGEWHDWLAYGLLHDEWQGRDHLVEHGGYRERWALVEES